MLLVSMLVGTWMPAKAGKPGTGAEGGQGTRWNGVRGGAPRGEWDWQHQHTPYPIPPLLLPRLDQTCPSDRAGIGLS